MLFGPHHIRKRNDCVDPDEDRAITPSSAAQTAQKTDEKSAHFPNIPLFGNGVDAAAEFFFAAINFPYGRRPICHWTVLSTRK
jgi:hypothetical protein